MSTDDLKEEMDELNRRIENILAVIKRSLNPPSKWIDKEEILRILKCSERSLQTLRENEILKFTRPLGPEGSKFFYLRKDVEDLFEKNFNGKIWFSS
jgi:hypothetical protein